MTVPPAAPMTSINRLSSIVGAVIQRAGGRPPGRLDLWYLRRKPKRGLIAVYAVPAGGPPLACLWVAESAMSGAGLRWSMQALADADLTGTWPGVVQVPTMGVTIQAFPHDAGLGALAEVTAADPGGPAFTGVRDALREAVGDPSFTPQSVSSEPLRYKPSDRCVLRFMAHPGGETVVGKVYADPAVAASIHARTTELYDHQLADARGIVQGQQLGPPLLPRPLAHVDPLGFTVSEDVRTLVGREGRPVVEATKILHPGALRMTSSGAMSAIAVGLARMHAYPWSTGWPTRTAAAEAERVVRRAEQLAAYAPGHGERALALGERVAESLNATEGVAARAAHGSFKPAQLLFSGDRLFITDFDQLCAADPALDVGYFLAYLRPASLWYHRSNARSWFDALQDEFLQTYTGAFADLVGDADEAHGVAARSRFYSAALMFKIANRRPNRLNSVRSGELEAMLAEIHRCLDAGSRRRC